MADDAIPKLFDWQAKATERALKAKEFALFAEMGVGKTFCTINILRSIFTRHKKLLSTLILCPPIVIENWRREWLKFSKVNPDLIVPLIGTGKQRLATFKKHSGKPCIFITNYESLGMGPLFETLCAYRPKVLVADECHLLKNISAQRTKKVITLADFSEYRYILTGTPVLNSPLDLFSQFRILDKGETFGQNYFLFRAKYFTDRNAHMARQRYFPNWQIKQGATEAISRAIAKKSVVVKKADCLDLPELLRKEIFIDLSPEQRKHYDAIRKDFITFLGDSVCTAPLAITKALRLQQIASGHLPTEDGNERGIHEFKDNPRIEAFKEIVESTPKEAGILVWANFTASYAAIRKAANEMGISYVEIHGGVSQADKVRAVDNFQNNPGIKLCICHPNSGGVGINLTRASYSVFFSRGFSLGEDLQAESRNHRSGSEIHSKITRIDIIAKDTIDETVAKALSNKQTISDKLLKQHFLGDTP